MNRSPGLALLWLLAIVFGGSPTASPAAAIQPVTLALRHGEAHAAPTIYVPARAQRLQAALPGPSSHPRTVSPSADLLPSRQGEASLFDARVDASMRGVDGPASSPRHGFPRFPTGPPSHV
jgi:hypothetical protein